MRGGIRLDAGGSGMNLGEGPVQLLEQPAGIEVEAAGAQFESLAACQLGKAVRQFVGARHRGPFDEDRDDADMARQGGLDLEAHEVIGVVEAGPALLIGDREPLITDQRKEHVTGPDRGVDRLDPVVAECDRVDVLEDLVASVPIFEAVEEPAGCVGGLLAPITDEDSA
jgi:hypothetical protein